MARSWRVTDTPTCLYCGSDNVTHQLVGGVVVVHKCEDCKQQWDDPIREE